MQMILTVTEVGLGVTLPFGLAYYLAYLCLNGIFRAARMSSRG